MNASPAPSLFYPFTLSAAAVAQPAPLWPWMSFPSAFLPPMPPAACPMEEKPLDLSARSGPVVRDSVIQSTRTHKEPVFLPSCSQPEVSIPPPTPTQQQQQQQQQPSTTANTPPNRMSYPREFKLMVIDYFYTHGLNKYRTCKEFQITKSMLNGWLTKADKIRQSKPGALKSGRSGRRPQFPQIEQQLHALYLERVAAGEKISNRWIRETARTLATSQCSSKELSGMCQFSERWLSNFKKRFAIGTTCADGGKGSSDSSTVSGDESSQKATPSEDEDEGGSCCSDLSSTSCGSTAQMAQAVLQQPGQLPIQAFYEKFPWLCRKPVCPDAPFETNTDPSIRATTPISPPSVIVARGRKVQFPEVEKRLFLLVQEHQDQATPQEKISNKWLQMKAREIAQELQTHADMDAPPTGNGSGVNREAVFSDHWLHNFKRRFGLQLSKTDSPKKL